MNHCGEPLNETNIPKDWKKQIQIIVKVLSSNNLFNNDMKINNFLVKNNVIHIIDFGWSTSNPFFPYLNIFIDDIGNYENFIELLDEVYQRFVEKKIYFIEKYS